MSDEPRTAPTAAAPSPAVTSVRVRYFAGARAAAGTPEELVRPTPASGSSVTVADVIEAMLANHDGRLARVVEACSFLVDGVAVRNRDVVVGDGAEFDVLPPFAGG